MIEILWFDGCPNYDGLETRIRALVDRLGYDTPVTVRRIDSNAQAQRSTSSARQESASMVSMSSRTPRHAAATISLFHASRRPGGAERL
jgi:hypothetical protein